MVVSDKDINSGEAAHRNIWGFPSDSLESIIGLSEETTSDYPFRKRL
jgi:hypothetical protein